MQQDSIIVQPLDTGQTGQTDTVSHTSARPQTPYQVLRLLPKDTSIPLYYRDSYFSNDSLYHPELAGGRFGVAGDPIPYAVGNDNVVTGLMLVCFVMTLLAFSACRDFLFRQAKNIFYIPKSDTVHETTSNEMKALLYFAVQTCLLATFLYYHYAKAYVAETFVLPDEYMVIGLVFAVLAGYFMVRVCLYNVVNLTFFDRKKNGQFFQSLLFLTAVEGIVVYPAVLLQSYFNVSLISILYYGLAVLILVKILTFYKCYVIFFRRNEFFLQIILYFCALEIIPMAALWGGLTVMINALKINF